jgi:tRNA(Ser,Leu) C12 N-acetylase TAN1
MKTKNPFQETLEHLMGTQNVQKLTKNDTEVVHQNKDNIESSHDLVPNKPNIGQNSASSSTENSQKLAKNRSKVGQDMTNIISTDLDKLETFHVQITKRDRLLLEARAKEEGCSMGALIRRSIRTLLAKKDNY